MRYYEDEGASLTPRDAALDICEWLIIPDDFISLSADDWLLMSTGGTDGIRADPLYGKTSNYKKGNSIFWW